MVLRIFGLEDQRLGSIAGRDGPEGIVLEQKKLGHMGNQDNVMIQFK
jgi:hypothetical protein